MPGNILDSNLQSCAGLETIVCMSESEVTEQIVDGLLELECKVYMAKSPEDALSKLQFQFFCVVVLDEKYSIEIMQFLAFLPMVVRRNIFYVVVGDSMETGNRMQSYVLSANLVINTKDASTIPEMVSNAVMENNYFYRQFSYALQTAGR